MKGIMESVVVVDVESGGLNPETDAVLQVALVASGGRALSVDVLDLVGRRSEVAMGINRIDWEVHEVFADPPAVAATKIGDWLRSVQATLPEGVRLIVAGHNTGFDVAMLRRVFMLAGMECPVSWYRSLDTQTLLFQARLRGEIPAGVQGLDAALEHYGITPPGEKARHTALGDAVATRALLCHMLEEEDC
jgi:ribonuclease T